MRLLAGNYDFTLSTWILFQPSKNVHVNISKLRLFSNHKTASALRTHIKRKHKEVDVSKIKMEGNVMTIKPKNEYREPNTETVYIKQEMDDPNFNENSNNFLPLPDPNFIQDNGLSIPANFVEPKNSNRLV